MVKYALDNPDKSYAEIGEVFRIKRQRAFEIIKKDREREASRPTPSQP